MDRLNRLQDHLSPVTVAGEDTAFPTSIFLQDNYKPIDREIDVAGLPVVLGKIPIDLDGYFVRTGPNAFFDFTNKPYHYFDGDGMVHAIRLKNGQAWYSNRWIKTKRLEADKQRGFSFSENAEFSLGILDNQQHLFDENGERMGKANISILCHAKKVMALDEQDKPYLLQLPSLETLGRYDFNSQWKNSFTAHPKVDPSTKELIFFSYSIRRKGPWFVHGVADASGKVIRSVPVQLRGPTMIHDCAITERFTIVLDMPLRFDMKRATQGESPWVFDNTSPSKFGLLPRYSVDGKDIRWFDFKPCYIYHTSNAWEEDDKVYLIACRSPIFTNSPTPSLANPENGTYAHEFVFDLKTGKSSERRLHGVSGDFPVIDGSRVGRKNRFFYHVTSAIIPGREGAVFKSVVKYDRKYDSVVIHTLQNEMHCGEFVFVPKPNRKESSEDGEDDGYLVSFCHDEKRNVSEFYIIDAKTMAEDPVARIQLPQRVPWGFHGNWIGQAELD